MAEHKGIVIEALEDYRRWFDDEPSDEDKEKCRQIDSAIEHIHNSKPGLLDDAFFEITALSREDIKGELNLTDEQAERISDDIMREIASKMASDYCEQLFWSSLRIIAEAVFENEGISFENQPKAVSITG